MFHLSMRGDSGDPVGGGAVVQTRGDGSTGDPTLRRGRLATTAVI